jgi:hypothetical protein
VGPRCRILPAIDLVWITVAGHAEMPALRRDTQRMDDAAAAAETLGSREPRTLSDHPFGGTAGGSIVFVHPKDVGGVLVELIPAPTADATGPHLEHRSVIPHNYKASSIGRIATRV